MAGVQQLVTVESSPVARALEALVRRSLDLSAPMDEIGSMLVTSAQQRMEDETGPDGEDWPDLTPAVRKRRGSSAKMLRDSGRLFASLTHTASAFQVEAGTNLIYGAIQQLGGTSDMPPGPAAVPARPYLGINDDDEREIEHILLDHLAEVAR